MQSSQSHFTSVSQKTEELKGEITARDEDVETLFSAEIVKDVPTGELLTYKIFWWTEQFIVSL